MAANYYKTNMDKIKRTITKIANERVKKYIKKTWKKTIRYLKQKAKNRNYQKIVSALLQRDLINEWENWVHKRTKKDHMKIWF